MTKLSFSDLEPKAVLPSEKTTATGGEPHKMEGGKRRKKRKTAKKHKKTNKSGKKKGKKTV